MILSFSFTSKVRFTKYTVCGMYCYEARPYALNAFSVKFFLYAVAICFPVFVCEKLKPEPEPETRV